MRQRTVNTVKRFAAFLMAFIMTLTNMAFGPGIVYAEEPPIYIRTLTTELFSGAGANNTWTANSSAAGHAFGFRINYAISGIGEVEEAGKVKLVVPASILTDRNSAAADILELSIPSKEDYEAGEEIDKDINFAWYREGDNIVLYNIRKITAGDNGYIELSYATSKTTYNYVDMADMRPFTCTMTVDNGADGVSTKTAPPITVRINTTATLNSTSKQYPTLFKTWNNSWGTAPADSANYYYLWWPIYSTISATQPYNFSFADSVTAEVSNDEKTWHDVSAEVVAYKFAGQSVFGTVNSVPSQTTTGYRYDYVVTKITASEVDPYDHWRIHNTITATVDPVDQVDPDTTKVSKRTFVWDKPFFKYPTGHFMQYKRADGAYRTYHPLSIYTNSQHAASSVSMKAGYYSRYDLNDFQDGTLATLGGLDYAAWMVGYPYPWTIEDGVTRDQIMQDPELYFGKVPVEYDLYDDRVYFQHNDSVTMTSDDYRITKLDYSYLMRDAVISSETANFTAVPVTYTDNDIIRFYGNFFGAANAETPGNWVNFAAANLKTGELTYDSTYVESMSPSSIVFKDTANLTQYRVNAKNAHYYTEIFTVPNIELKHSAYVDGQLAGRDDAGITNHAYAIFRKNDGTEILRTEEADTDYVRITQKNSHIAKSAVAATNNVKKRYYTITWKVNANETITYGAGETGFVPQATGVFYDLLPKGANIDVNSVDVADGNTFLSESSFRVQTVPNYKNTGRTLLIVYIDTEGENFSVYFDTIHSWNSIADFGKDVYNPTAYRTGNSKITNGSADDGGSITEKTLMAGLGYLDDNGNGNPADTSGNVYDGTEPRYIYGQRTFDILALTAASAGLIKQVKREGEKNYSYDTYTTINGDYSYRIRFMNSYTTKAKDMIFFDSMENYSITEGRTSSVEHVSDWHGTITGIDLSQLTNAGAAPVLYVSTISDLDVEDHHDITDSSVWTMVPNPDSYDYSDVKAIAIDVRRKRSGEEFILDKGESVTATVFMRAPAEAPAVTGDYPYTYNNIYISDTVMSDDTEAGFFIHQDYTSVALKVAGSFGLKKVSSENPSTTIKDIQFRLRGISDYGTEVDQIVSTNSVGEISFNDIELATAGGNGGYILQEYLTNDDWLLDMTEHRVYVDGYGKVWIDGVEYTNGTIVLSNNPRIHGDLRIYKEELGTENDEYPVMVAGCSFRLSGVSDYGTDVNMYAETSVTGVANFRNIELGTYELKEVSSNPYYVPNTETFTVVVDETGKASITSTSEYNTKRENGYDVILNEPRYHNLKLTKKDATDGRTIQGAEFTLTGISDLGNALDVTGVADASGMLVFEDIEKGTYVLKETAAPTGVDEYGHTGTGGVRNYIGDQNEYIVKIDKTGNVTINGLEQNGAGFFEVMNERALDGEIIVTKIWDDMVEDGDSRPFPTIHISTIDPTQKKLTITYDADGGKYTDNSTENYVTYLIDQAVPGTHGAANFSPYGEHTIFASAQDVLSGIASMFVEGVQTTFVPMNVYAADIASGTFDGVSWRITEDKELVIGNGGTQTFTYWDDQRNWPWKNAGEITSVRFDGTVKGSGFMDEMFRSVGNDPGTVVSIDMTGFDGSGVETASHMFSNNPNLTSINIGNLDLSGASNIYSMFQNCTSLTSVDLSGMRLENANDVTEMFSGCTSLQTVKLGSLYLGYSTRAMFDGCSSLTSVNFTNADASDVHDIAYIFRGCSTIKEINISSFNAEVTRMDAAFDSCTSLKTLNLTGIDLSGKTLSDLSGGEYSQAYMIYNCPNLTKVVFPEKFFFCSTEAPFAPESDENYTIPYEDHHKWIHKKNLLGGKTNDNTEWEAESIYQAGYNAFDGSSTFSLGGTWERTDHSNTIDLGGGDFEYVSEDDGWVKNGNTWIYKFNVFDENAKYYLWEDDLTGYESSATPTHYAIINDGTITKHGEVTNREIIDYGALEIRKTVDGAEDSRDFLFDVTLAGAKIFTGSQVIDGIAFTNGKATVKVKHGETLRIENIPAGTTYTVSEHEYADYTTTYTGSTGTITTDTTSAVAVETGVTGTITANETAVIAATNTHTAPPEEPTDITIQKIVSGYRETESSYTFYMSMRGLHPGITYFTSNDRSFTADENGEANITLTLQNEESVTINGVPVGTIYRVTEEAGDYTASYTVELGGATIDEGAVNTKDTQLSTADITASEASTVTFTNRIAYSQDLVVKKTLTNGIQGDEEENFEITAEFTDLAANAYYRSDIGRITSDEDGYAIKTFLLKQNESVRFYGLPTGSRYRIKEAAYGKFIATYEITGTNVTAVSASGGNTEAGKEMTTSRELVNQGEEAVVTINNERVMTGSVGLYKHNTEDTPEPLMGAVFQLFRTAASAGTDEDVYIGEYTTNEAGKLTASNLSAGDYYFLEKIAPDGYRISAATFPVTLTTEQIIAQNNNVGGALVDDPSVYPVADAPNMLSTATVTITATKTMTNGTLTAGAYTFVLEKDGTELQRTSNAATGEVAFLPITYHLADAGKTFTYTVRELANAGTDVYYDTAEYTVTVEVTDDNGELKADIVSITK